MIQGKRQADGLVATASLRGQTATTKPAAAALDPGLGLRLQSLIVDYIYIYIHTLYIHIYM